MMVYPGEREIQVTVELIEAYGRYQAAYRAWWQVEDELSRNDLDHTVFGAAGHPTDHAYHEAVSEMIRVLCTMAGSDTERIAAVMPDGARVTYDPTHHLNRGFFFEPKRSW
jgi:hypothetical protein